VRNLGGKIIIVTNRQAPLGEPTVKNLEKVGIPFDVCLLREGVYKEDRSKAARRTDIEKGAVKNLPLGKRLLPLEILMLAGDQTHDLYEDETFDQVKARYGKDLIVIPNPMYGDWTGATFEGPAGPARSRPAAADESPDGPDPDPPAARTGSSSRSPASRAAITWQEAMDKVGQTVTVEAQIVNVYDPAARGSSGPVKLNTDRDWATSLTIVLFNKDGQFGDPARFDGKTIRATGKVSVYRDATQLTVFGPDTIEIVD
ncbi:MAG: HAD family acid phosphatase, partial [Candidatus Erginobacter occultus]|nr:HAD family acid phosphatase [Candidatus Erginobacter occultus]